MTRKDTPSLVHELREAIGCLRQIEWSATVEIEDGGYEPGCPVCEAPERVGWHAVGCRLARILNAKRGVAA